MKCVCGYEYEEDWSSGDKQVIKGDEEFIAIDCHVTIRENFQDNKVHLFACPKCKTVQVDTYFY